MSADLGALIAELQPFAQALVDLAGRAGVQPRVTSTLRTHSQQKRLYAAYLRGESKYPVAPPGLSAHEYGFAFDMLADSREDLHDLGTVWRQWGGIWSPDDEVHFEYPGFNPRAVVQGEIKSDKSREKGFLQEAASAAGSSVVPFSIELPALFAGVDVGEYSAIGAQIRATCDAARFFGVTIPGCYK